MLLKHLIILSFLLPFLSGKAQNQDYSLISKCSENAFSYFNRSADSEIIAKHIRLDLLKSSYYNEFSKIYMPVSQSGNAFKIDRIDLSFAVIYRGDTVRNLYYEFDSLCHMLPRTPYPNSFYSSITPYIALFKGKLAFDYKKLKQKLYTINLSSSIIKSIELRQRDVIDYSKKIGKYYNTKTQYFWIIFTDCPEIKCRQLEISATDGHLIADDLVKTH